ncbi:MAG: HAMP domain-containing sensor histidine kinase, partial [Patescibacteria group bacterium]
TAFFSNEISGVFSIPSWFLLIVSLLLFLCFGIIAFRRQREFDSMKYEFVNVVTHKFRTPLSAIKWASDNLKKDMTKDERLLFAKQIESSADRLTEITNTLVGVAETGDRYSYIFVAHSFREIVESVLDRQGYKAREKGIALNISIDHDLPSLSLDVKKVQFVVEVLFENAVRYSPPHSAITIAISRTPKGVLLSVSDNGMGVKKEDISKMFEKFFRSREATKIDTEGMGLGLFLAKNIVDRHGGKIWVESDGEGKGATFLVELYLRPQE